MTAKRFADSEAGRTAPAKAKKAKATPMLDAVIKGLCECADRQCVSEEVRTLFIELARGGLMTVSDERHAYQVAAVRKVEKLLTDHLHALQDDVKKTQQDLTNSECEVQTLNDEQSRAVAEQSTAATASLAARRRLAEATRMLLAAQVATKDAETAGERSKLVARDAEVEKARTDSMWQESLNELQEAGPKGKPCKSLMELAKKVSIDDTLLAVLAGVAAHLPEERGSFDKLALEQFERHVENYLAPFVAAIDAATSGTEASNAATETARADETRLRLAQLAAAEHYRQGVAAEKEIVTNIAEFDSRTSALERQGAMFTQAVNDSARVLEAFQSWPMACFETLRERTSKNTEEPAVADGLVLAATSTIELEKKIGTTRPLQATSLGA
jgi:hypothetical protein